VLIVYTRVLFVRNNSNNRCEVLASMNILTVASTKVKFTSNPTSKRLAIQSYRRASGVAGKLIVIVFLAFCRFRRAHGEQRDGTKRDVFSGVCTAAGGRESTYMHVVFRRTFVRNVFT